MAEPVPPLGSAAYNPHRQFSGPCANRAAAIVQLVLLQIPKPGMPPAHVVHGLISKLAIAGCPTSTVTCWSDYPSLASKQQQEQQNSSDILIRAKACFAAFVCPSPLVTRLYPETAAKIRIGFLTLDLIEHSDSQLAKTMSFCDVPVRYPQRAQ